MIRFGRAPVLVGMCILSGCGPIKPDVRQTQETKQETVVERQVETPPQPAEPARPKHRLLVVAAESPPGAQAVEDAMTRSLEKRGYALVDPSKTTQADLVVTIASAARKGGSWGGIPSYEVMLRFTLLDPGQRAPLAEGVDSARYADPSAQRGLLGALSRVAGNLARKIDTAIDRLPPQVARRSVDVRRPAKDEPAVPAVSLACLPFRNATNRPQLDGWCQTLSSIAAGEFNRLRMYRIVERTRLQEIIGDADIINAVQGGQGAMRRVGEKLGVDMLLVGEVALRPNGELAISARVVNGKNAEVRQVIIATGPAAQVDRLERAFRRRLARPVAGWVNRQLDELRRAPAVWPDATRSR